MNGNRAAQHISAESSDSDVVEVCRGSFTATLERYLDCYTFAIRDRGRAAPAIHGCGADRQAAIHAVEKLLEKLAA